ncbi:hypothetical protein [Pseudotamlana carrageenivorans]|uniref:Uncharacterized protein n=1 Tax=Pseudotamlana carrageenivorans TaxID=2069432 RepID=A0A2I7SFX5_9FLAO|nr:hypothetical protein [Tamlana carrageenivorans]AUS04806.1 hypothetical protein C1A40_04640 [Tamlana carrageenivorans]
MRIIKMTFMVFVVSMLTNCASGYKDIQLKSLNYISKNEQSDIILEYKYDLLDKKYAKKEVKRGVKLVAVRITNNSNEDIIFGRDVKLGYVNGQELYVLDNDKVYKTLKQSPASYLWYLLLSPINLYTYETNGYGGQETTNSFPIGLILGPGIAGGNMIAAGNANKKFKTQMLDYNLYGTVIKSGEVKHGLIGIEADSYEALTLTVE